MKNIFSVIIFIFSLNAFSQNWRTNFEDAISASKTESKKIILVFSGSDWCAPCIKLDKSIWQSEEFKKYSNENYILYKADFPKKKANQLSETLKKQNLSLAEKYNQNGNYPLVVVLNGEGKVFGMLGYKNISPLEYIEAINNLDKK